MTSIEFGNLVKDRRKAVPMSQASLGLFVWPNKTDAVAQKKISLVERGINLLDPKSLATICRKLNIKPVPSVETMNPREVEFYRRREAGSLSLLYPEISQEDFLLISENTTLIRMLESEFAAHIKAKCSRFRKALGIPEPE